MKVDLSGRETKCWTPLHFVVYKKMFHSLLLQALSSAQLSVHTLYPLTQTPQTHTHTQKASQRSHLGSYPWQSLTSSIEGQQVLIDLGGGAGCLFRLILQKSWGEKKQPIMKVLCEHLLSFCFILFVFWDRVSLCTREKGIKAECHHAQCLSFNLYIPNTL